MEHADRISDGKRDYSTRRQSSSLLINEEPLQVIPSLACLIGLEEAIILQQVHYWLARSKNEKNGRKWVYNTYPEWQKQFPFISQRTVERVFRSLSRPYPPPDAPETFKSVLPVRGALLLIDQFSQNRFDHTNWYSIDYDELEGLRSRQVVGIHATPDVVIGNGYVAPSLHETNQETTPEITGEDRAPLPGDSWRRAEEFVGEMPQGVLGAFGAVDYRPAIEVICRSYEDGEEVHRSRWEFAITDALAFAHAGRPPVPVGHFVVGWRKWLRRNDGAPRNGHTKKQTSADIIAKFSKKGSGNG